MYYKNYIYINFALISRAEFVGENYFDSLYIFQTAYSNSSC